MKTKTPAQFEQFCHVCNDDRLFHAELQTETQTIRGEEITAQIPMWVCEKCKSSQPGDPSVDPDPVVIFFDAYRAKHDLLYPAEIKEIRETYNLSHEAFAAVLGMSPATLFRYEAGGLQDQVHDELIRLCRKPENMKEVFARHAANLAPIQIKRFEAAIGTKAG